MKKLLLPWASLRFAIPSTGRACALYQQILFAAILVALPCRFAGAQTTSNTVPIGLYHFPFPPGTNLAGQTETNGLTWAAAGPAGPQITIASNNLPVRDLATPTGNRARLAGVNGPAARIGLGTNVTSGTLYYSLALQVANLGTLSTNGGTLAAFNNATGSSQNLPTALAARLLIRAVDGGYQLGVSPSLDNFMDWCFYWFTQNPADSHFVVVACDLEDAITCKLWVDPDPSSFGQEEPPSCTHVLTGDRNIDRISSFVLMQRPQPNLPAVTFVDEVRVGGTWASVTPPGMDFGDAPEGPYPYPTTMMRNGARHGGGPGPLFFGTNKDLEPDGKPTVPADGDDLTGGPNDETGIVFGGTWSPGGSAWVDITVSAAGRVDAWVDWNHVAAWEPAEKIINNQPVTPGAPVRFMFTVPGGIPPGQTYARFRLSTVGGLTPVGFAADGAVQDYRVEVRAAPNLRIATVVTPNPAIDSSNLTYSITVSNASAGAASDVVVSNSFFDIDWWWFRSASITTSQGSCSNTASGVVCNLGTLQPGAVATINIVGVPDYNQLATALNIPIMQEVIEVTNTVTVTSAQTDATLTDNNAVVVVGIVPLRDFGDAPDATVGPSFAYPTRLVDNGARHRILGPYFSGSAAGVSNRDPDPDGMPAINADGDDLLDGNDDEEGVQFLDPVYPGATGVRVRINAPLGGRVDAWIDFNRDGQWTMGAPEQIFTTMPVAPGTFIYTFNVPAGAVAGPSYARFRISNAGGLAFTGYADNGEVQDQKVQILPDINLAVRGVGDDTLLLNEDELFTATFSVANNGSNTANNVQFTATLPPNVTAQSASCSNGVCQVIGSNVTCQITRLAPGQNSIIAVGIIATAENLPGHEFGNLADLAAVVSAAETDSNPADNQIAIPALVLFAQDWGDAPNGYPVTKLENGARHRRKGGFFLGVAWDREANGTHSPNSDFDDLNGATPDDEDGITFLAPVAPGAPAQVIVVASAAGYLDAWADFNNDGDWADAGEQIFASKPLVMGANVLTFTVPTYVKTGRIFSRWRLSETGGLSYTGPGGNGEVEDHAIPISARLDFGDAPEIIPGPAPVVTTYEVTLARNGARHDVSQLRLGNNKDAEIDGQPSTLADLDDNTGVPDDEDGWMPVPFVAGTAMNITVYVNGGNGLLDVWVDWDHNYNWDAPEHQIVAWPVGPGANLVPMTVPGGIPNGYTYARFRLSTLGSALPSGYAADGDVEDYYVQVTGGAGSNDNPNPVNFAGLQHKVLGNAALTVSSNGLQISNLGSNGQDGVSIALGQLDGWQATLLHQLNSSNRTDGSRIEWTVLGEKNGQTNQPIIAGRLERTPAGLALYEDGSLIGATTFDVAIISNRVTMSRTTVPSGFLAAVAEVNARLMDMMQVVWQGPRGPIKDEWGNYCSIFGWSSADPSQTLEIRYRPTSVSATVGKFTAVQLRGVNSGHFWLRDEAVAQLGAYMQAADNTTTLLTESNRVRFLPGSNGVAHARLMASETTNKTGGCLAFHSPGISLGVSGRTATFRATDQAGNSGVLTLARGADGKLAVRSSFTYTGELNRVTIELFNSTSSVSRVSLPAGDLGTLFGGGRIITAGAAQGNVPVLSVVFDAPMTFTAGGLAQAATGLRVHPDLDNNRTVWQLLDRFDVETVNEERMEWIDKIIIRCPGPTRPLPPQLPLGGHLRLTFASEAGVDYLVQSSDDLTSSAPTTLQRLTGTGGMLTIEDTRSPTAGARFYRVVPTQESVWEGLRGIW